MTTLSDLISKLEGVTEGSHDLSWQIAEALGWTKFWSGQTIYLPPGVAESDDESGSDGSTVNLPAFSTSVDAALTLVPEGDWGVNWDIESVHGGVCAYVWLKHPTNESSFVRYEPMPSYREAMAHLPRLICIASLKSRSV